MAKHSKRLRRLIKNGGTPFACPNCPRVFATERDLGQHIKDAPHRKKERQMSQRHHHNDNHGKRTGGGFTALFRQTPKSDELFVVDFSTPHDKTPCRKPKCKAPAIPLTGFCIEHDPLCVSMATSRRLKAEAEAAKAAAKPPAIIYPDRQALGYYSGCGYGHSMYDRYAH